MKLKPPPKIKDPYLIRFRIKSKIGIWGEWQGERGGEWQGLEHAQNRIRMLKRSLKDRTIEIEFTHNGVKLGFDGNETDKNLVYETK